MKRTSILHPAMVALFVLIGLTADGQPLLNIQSGVQLGWSTATNKTYRPQWSPNPVGSWTDLTGLLPGDGTTNFLFDPFPSGSRNYQVMEMVPGFPPSASIPTNGGFEFGTSATASNWTV